MDERSQGTTYDRLRHDFWPTNYRFMTDRARLLTDSGINL